MKSSGHTALELPANTVVGGDDDVAYRTVSSLSLVSVVLGLASPLCFIAPLLLAIPITGAVLALLAVRRIALSEGTMIGRGAALVALALSIASLSAAFSRTVVMEQLLSRQARQVALEWFALLQRGEVENAFALTVDSARPTAPPGPPDASAAASEAVESPLERFRLHPVVRYLVIGDGAIEVEYQRDLGFDPGVRGKGRIEQEYLVRAFQPTSPAPPATILVTLQRLRSGDMPAQWLVAGTQSDELPSGGADRE